MSCESYYCVNNIYIIETDRFIFSRKARWDHLLLAWKIQHLQNENSGSLNILSISKRTGRFTSSLLDSILLCLSTTIIDLKSKIQIRKFKNRTINVGNIIFFTLYIFHRAPLCMESVQRLLLTLDTSSILRQLNREVRHLDF